MRKWTICIIIFFSFSAAAQNDSVTYVLQGRLTDFSHSNTTGRKWLIGGGTALAYSGTMIALNETWYKGFPRSSFHTFNDMGEWLQIDKLGHVLSTYQFSRGTTALWKWAGVPHKTSVWLGAGSGLLFMLSTEYMDGLSEEWGWSWPDAGADLLGAAAFAVQELTWQEQRLQIKFSFHSIKYSDPQLDARSKDLYGSGLVQGVLKDYNARTNWYSLNVRSFFPQSKLPKWLNISFGYGAEGMFGGYENVSYDKNGNVVFDRRDIKRFRQWYFAPDVDFTKIKTNSRLVRSLFFALNSFKFPAPSVEYSNGSFKLHAIGF